MKKFFTIAAALFFMFYCNFSVNAATNFQKAVGVVVIGGAEFKTPDYYKFIEKSFNAKSGAKIYIGGELQNKYQKFLLNRDLVGNEIPRKQDLIDFTAVSGYGKILFIVVSDSAIDHQNNAKRRQKDRISLQVDGYLCNNFSVIEVATTSQESKSKTSDLRARRGAFKKCLEDISKSLNRAM